MRDHSNQSELLTSVDSACISKRSGQEIRGFKNKRFQPSQPSRNGRKEITKNQYFSIGRLHRTSVKSTNRSKGYGGGTCQVSNDIMTEVDIPQGLEILQSCSHSERKRVHTTTIYSTALDDRLGFRLGGAEGLSPPEHSGTFVGLGFWPPLHQSRCRCNAHVLYEVVCPSTLSFRDSVITEHLDEWCAGYSLFSVQDFLTSLSHMAESQTDTKVPQAVQRTSSTPPKTKPPRTLEKWQQQYHCTVRM